MASEFTTAFSKWWRRLSFGAALIVLLLWLALRTPSLNEPAEEHLLQREFPAMGTLVSFTVWLDDTGRRASAEQALDQAQRFLRDEEQRWSAWGDGELGAVNRQLASGEAVQIPPALQRLFTRSAALTLISEGLFDPRVGELVRLWGFDDESHYRQTPPDESAIAVGLAALRRAAPYREGMSYGPAPGIAWDFGAIAKGDAVHRLSQELTQAGFPDHIVNAGGNLMVAGQRGARAWNIGIQHPRADQGTRILATLQSQGEEAVITSGDYERYFLFQGRRYHHILDPRSGMPAQGLQSVTVVTADGALADAASTALFVAGPQHWRVLATRLGLDQVLVVDANGAVQVTAKLARRLQFATRLTVERLP